MAADHIPPPDPRDLLPPLLACLATASASKQPPPALLPLLSPILRQRVQLLASDSWLPLLCWDREVASRLSPVANNIHVEPHPVSGEIEIEDPDRILYRRSDPETLHARLVLGEFGLVVTYLWCTGGEGGNAWKLAELRGAQDEDDGTQWFASMSEANEAGFRRKPSQMNGYANQPPATTVSQASPTEEEDDDDDAYWAAYDRTPGPRTPAKRSPAPVTNGRVQVGPTQTEMDYFARYASEVQPALDAHDPDEEDTVTGESTLNGNALNIRREPQTEPLETTNLGPNGYDSSFPPDFSHANGNDSSNGIHTDSSAGAENNGNVTLDEARYASLNHPRPSSPSSSTSVERLEREAESSSQAELAIKQHISTDMKSLFRLARASGISREEFERIIKRELEVLPMLEQDN